MRHYQARRVRFAYAREFYLLGIAIGLLFLAISLFTHNVHDGSWFYASTEDFPIHNKAGFFGALVSALIFYLFGMASFILLAFLGFVFYFVYVDRNWRSEWERLVAFAILLFAAAGISFGHALNWHETSTAGGVVGRFVFESSADFFDEFVALLFLYALIFVSLILIFRVSWIMLVSACVCGLRSVGRFFLSRERFWRPAYAASCWLVHAISYPFIWMGRFAVRLCSDAVVSRAEYTVADFEPVLDHELSDLICETKLDAAGDFSVDDNRYAQKTVMDSAQEDKGVAHCVEKQNETVCRGAGVKTIIGKKESEGGCSAVVKTYQLPNLSIFIGLSTDRHDKQMKDELRVRARLLEEKLERFGVQGKVTALKYGPVVTLFEYQPAIDTKLSKIVALEDDLALALEAISIRILAPIPGRSVVGFEVANQRRLDVPFAPIVRSREYQSHKQQLPLVLGHDTIGNQVIVDLVKMPHLLIAGSTGSGKSVALNVMLMSLLCRLSPDDLKLVLIDPKRLEFASYADIAHLVFPVITDALQATMALSWVVQEMEKRYEKMAACGVRTINDYRATQTDTQRLPYIVVVIDELADLMMTAGKECQDLITRITQMARAAGIHLIVATQRPSVDVITGLIKANFPSRISFRVASKIDSRTILDCGGADKLLGRGDMLFLDATSSFLQRVHGAYVSDKEIEGVISHIRAERPVVYRDLFEEVGGKELDQLSSADDTLYKEVRIFLDQVDEVSISLLQRRFRIGYNRSARIIDMLEAQGMLMPPDGGKTRKVIH